MAARLRFLNPPALSKPPGYTHVVEVTGPARTIYISGQLGLDAAGNLAGPPGEFRAQAVQAFENMKDALAAVGAGFKDIVKFNYYLTNLSHLPILREVRDGYANMAAPPASTLLEISRLAREGAYLEIEAIAVLPEKVSRARAAPPSRGKARRSPARVAPGRRKGR